MADQPAEIICVDAQYNEIDCEDARAAFQYTREEAKALGGKVKKAAPKADVEDKAEEAPQQTKAVGVAPANKSK